MSCSPRVLPLQGSADRDGYSTRADGGTPLAVDTKGLVAKIKCEAPWAAF